MTLLIVEDSAQLAQLMRRHLQGQGYADGVASDVGAANEAVAARAYAGVALDLGLPGEDVLSWLGRLRAKGDAAPVLAGCSRWRAPVSRSIPFAASST